MSLEIGQKVKGIIILYFAYGKVHTPFVGTLRLDYTDGSYEIDTATGESLLIETYCKDELEAA